MSVVFEAFPKIPRMRRQVAVSEGRKGSSMSQQEPREERDFDTVLQDDVRPAREDGTCFYCASSLGEQHDPDCAIRWGAGHYFVFIRDNATEEVRKFREDSIWNDTAEFMWTEGNFNCDCNRARMFDRAVGVDPGWDKSECGNDRFWVSHIELPDGTVVLRDA